MYDPDYELFEKEWPGSHDVRRLVTGCRQWSLARVSVRRYSVRVWKRSSVNA